MQQLNPLLSADAAAFDWQSLPTGTGLTGLDGRVRPALAGYKLVRRIGEGRRSVVWLAQDVHGAEVALKVADRSAAAAFAREFELARRLSHPNIVRVLEHGCAGGVAFLAMEYAAGGPLAARVGRPLPVAQALRLLSDAAAALANLHEQGLVHRDVKPANFLLRADHGLLLADFGLAVIAGNSDGARPGALFGTPSYVAPEQLQGAPAAPAADVYGLGVLLHELLCGRPPFTGATLMEVLSQHLVALVPPLPAALAPLQPLADAMLAKQPRERLADARAVLAALAVLTPVDFVAPAQTGMTARGGYLDAQ